MAIPEGEIPYERSGRTGQKSRTRQALVDATRELLAQGLTPQVEDAAERANISRTTAYRYFANQRALLIGAQPQIQPDSLLGADAPGEPRARLAAFMDAFTRYNLEYQPQLRSALRLSLEPQAGPAVLRQGRAIGWIEDALAPLRETYEEAAVHQLAIAIRAATGIESLIWLLDVAGFNPDQAAETARRTALALLDATIGPRS